MAQQIRVWQNAWKDTQDTYVALSLPDDWEVTSYEMHGDGKAALNREQMREKINAPIGLPAIRVLAEQGKEAVIVFDDLSRGTPVKELAELVIEELLAGGIQKESIRFLCALGNHGALTRADFVKKLGASIVENFPVYNHNPYEHLVQVGVDSAGQPVLVNREFMACDIRIGIGSVSPHPLNGFGGGGKLIFPGVAGIKTTCANHSRREFLPFSPIPGGFRRDIEAMTRMVMPFFKIDAILNARLEIIDLYAGDPIEEYYKAVESSAINSAMIRSGKPKDIVIVNANAKYNEALIAVRIAEMDLREGGEIVMVNHCSAGQVVHYLYSAFGSKYGGKCWVPYPSRPKYKAAASFTRLPIRTSQANTL